MCSKRCASPVAFIIASASSWWRNHIDGSTPYRVTAGERPQRARQLWRWLYHAEGGWPNDAEQTLQLQNGLSQQFLETMRDRMTFEGGISLQSVHTASDGTRKLLSTLADGSPSDGLVETVMIPIVRRQVWPPCSHVSLFRVVIVPCDDRHFR